MFDKWIRFISRRLDKYVAATAEQRARIESERAGDEARQHAGREFVNAEGFTTPLPKAAENAQNVYARARRDFERSGAAKALMLFVAMLVARDRRDDTLAALKRHKEAEAGRRKTGIHPEVGPHYTDMFARGVEPRHLANVREETRAILADLIRWDGHDPEMADADNPMPRVFGIYASRLILQPGQFGDTARSVSGTPVEPKRYTDPRHYRFDEVVGQAPVAHKPDTEAVATTEPTVEAVSTTESGEAEAPEDMRLPTMEVVTDEIVVGGTDSGGGDVMTAEPSFWTAPYPLPPHLDEVAAAKLRNGALNYIRCDNEWYFELRAAAGFFREDLTVAEIIEKVEQTADDPYSTSFRYFTDAARLGGLEEGNRAYREATIRRFMLEIATEPMFADARKEMGLE